MKSKEEEIKFMQSCDDVLQELRAKEVTDEVIEEYSNIDVDIAKYAAASNLMESSFLLKKYMPDLGAALFLVANSMFKNLEMELDMKEDFENKIKSDSALNELLNEFKADAND